MASKLPEITPLIPSPATSTPLPRSNRAAWGLAMAVSLGVAGLAATRAVANFMASRQLDGGVFSLSTGVCAIFCICACCQMFKPLKSRTVVTVDSRLQDYEELLQYVDRALKEILPSPSWMRKLFIFLLEDLRLSMTSRLNKLKELAPHLNDIDQLKAALQNFLDESSASSSVTSPASSEGTLLSSVQKLRQRLAELSSSAVSSPVRGVASSAPLTSTVARTLNFSPAIGGSDSHV